MANTVKEIWVDINSGTELPLKVEEDALEQWESLTTQTPQQVYRTLTQQFNHASLELEITSSAIDGFHFRISSINAKEKESILISYAIDAIDREAKLLNAYIDKELQGKGTARKICGNFFRFFEEINIKRVDVSTLDVGPYTWAKFGFKPYDHEWHKRKSTAKNAIKKRLLALKKLLPSNVVQSVTKSLESSDPKEYWNIVDQDHICAGTKLGKLLTVSLDALNAREAFNKLSIDTNNFSTPINWNGYFDMKDPDCIQKRDAYLAAQ